MWDRCGEWKILQQPADEYASGVLRDANGFPIFDSKFEVRLKQEMYLAHDDRQFRQATLAPHDELAQNAGLANQLGLSTADIDMLANGITPDQFIWHHHQDRGRIQLVEQAIHQATQHTGGREIWGGGKDFRLRTLQ